MKRFASFCLIMSIVAVLISLAPGDTASAHGYRSFPSVPSCGNLGSELPAGYTLYSGDCLVNGSYQLIMQTDGNLVLYDASSFPARPIWADKTAGNTINGDNIAKMQYDCNFVNYLSNGRPIWSTRTGGRGSTCVLVLQGSLIVIYGDPYSASIQGGNVIWRSR